MVLNPGPEKTTSLGTLANMTRCRADPGPHGPFFPSWPGGKWRVRSGVPVASEEPRGTLSPAAHSCLGHSGCPAGTCEGAALFWPLWPASWPCFCCRWLPGFLPGLHPLGLDFRTAPLTPDPYLEASPLPTGSCVSVPTWAPSMCPAPRDRGMCLCVVGRVCASGCVRAQRPASHWASLHL